MLACSHADRLGGPSVAPRLVLMAAFSARASILIAVAASTAHADPPLEPHPESVANEPLPGEESGRTDPLPTDSAARVFLRGALFVPKVVVETILLPVHYTVYAYDRYQLDNAYYNVFYTHDREFGIVPTASFATGWGLTVGAQMVSTNTFGQNENLT